MLLSLCSHSIYIFSLFIISSSLNYFPLVSAGLSTFSGTTGNATCFLLTVSPTGCRGRPTSTTLCMKKRVSVIVFCLALMPSFRERFALAKSSSWIQCVSIDVLSAPTHPPAVKSFQWGESMDKHVADIGINKIKIIIIVYRENALSTAGCGILHFRIYCESYGNPHPTTPSDI